MEGGGGGGVPSYVWCFRYLDQKRLQAQNISQYYNESDGRFETLDAVKPQSWRPEGNNNQIKIPLFTVKMEGGGATPAIPASFRFKRLVGNTPDPSPHLHSRDSLPLSPHSTVTPPPPPQGAGCTPLGSTGSASWVWAGALLMTADMQCPPPPRRGGMPRKAASFEPTHSFFSSPSPAAQPRGSVRNATAGAPPRTPRAPSGSAAPRPPGSQNDRQGRPDRLWGGGGLVSCDVATQIRPIEVAFSRTMILVQISRSCGRME